MSSVYFQTARIWREERSSDNLAQIPPEWVSSLKQHAAELKRHIKLSADKKSINTQLREEELRVLSLLVGDILKVRMDKVVKTAVRGETPENMLAFEAEMHRKIADAVRLYQEVIERAANSLDLDQQVREVSDSPLIVFLKRAPALVDSKGARHGSFMEGDLAMLPNESVDILDKAGYIRRLQRPTK